MKHRITLLSIIAALMLLTLAACTPADNAAPEAELPETVEEAPPDVAEEPAAEEAAAEEPAADEAAAPAEDIMTVAEESGSTTVNQGALADTLETYELGDLSEEEAASLLFMREEEKLAHDVYMTLYDMWGLPIFQNIANSEQTHTDAVKALIDRYGLPDPAVDTPIGVFVDADLQALYDQLVATGSESLESALMVGAAIEEIDIIDLQEAIDGTDNEEIILVYENLMKGSRNHLRSFTSNIEQQTGTAYVPQYLDQASYDAIIEAGMERGGGH